MQSLLTDENRTNPPEIRLKRPKWNQIKRKQAETVGIVQKRPKSDEKIYTRTKRTLSDGTLRNRTET